MAGLLLVGSINITNLLLARAVGRRQQMAIAAALGAPRPEMLRMAMRETAVLAVVRWPAWDLLAAFLVPLMQHYLPPQVDFRGALHLDWTGARVCLPARGCGSTAGRRSAGMDQFRYPAA